MSMVVSLEEVNAPLSLIDCTLFFIRLEFLPLLVSIPTLDVNGGMPLCIYVLVDSAAMLFIYDDSRFNVAVGPSKPAYSPLEFLL